MQQKKGFVVNKTIEAILKVTYEVDTSWYDEGATAHQMVELDIATDPGSFLEDANVKVTFARFMKDPEQEEKEPGQ